MTGALSGVGSAVPYEVVPFLVSLDGDYDAVVQRTGDFWDTYLFIYRDSFDPLNQLVNRVAANDDCGSFDRSCVLANLLAGTSYFAVVTGFANVDSGTYQLNIRGPGDITLFPGGGGVIPEPATWAMLIAGFGLVGLAARRRRETATA